MAVIPSHVRESHFVLTDVPMTFFVALTLLLSLRAYKKGTVAAFAWAGAAAGLAAATKYNGLIALVMPLCAAYAATTDSGGGRLTRGLAAGGACVAAFVIGAPYTILDLPTFLNQYAALAGHYRPVGRATDPNWLVYLKHLRDQLGWPALVFAAAGFGLAVFRAFTGPGHIRFVMLVLFPAIYFYLIATSSIVFGRYLLPIIPFACLMAAIAVVSGVSLLRRFDFPRNVRTALIATGTIAALLPPLVNAIRFDRDLGGPTTQEQAYRWLRGNVAPGSRVIIEGRAVHLPGERYHVEHVKSLADADVQTYRNEKIDYIVASSGQFGVAMSAPQAQPGLYARYKALFDETGTVFVATPSNGVRGPEIRVLKIAK